MKKLTILIILFLICIPFCIEANTEECDEEVSSNVLKGNNNSLNLTWDSLENVIEYQLYRSTKENSGFKLIATLDSNTYVDKKLTYGVTYYYKVIYVLNNCRITSKVFSAKVKPNQVVNVSAKAGNKKVTITYDKTSNNGYEIYSSTDQEKWTKIKTITSNKALSYTNKDLKTNKTYYYKVRAYQVVNNKKIYGNYSEVVSAITAPSTPSITISTSGYNKIVLTIKGVKGASYYQVQRSTDKKKFEKIGNTETTEYIDESINPTVKYYYKVRACNSNKTCGSYSSVVNAKTKIKVPTLSGSAKVQEVNLSWTSVSYADGYQLYYSTKKDKGYTKLTTTKELSYNKNGLIPGKTYYFKVRSYVVKDEKKYYSSYSSIIALKPNLKKISGIKFEPSSKSIKLEWNSVSEATGYEVYMSKSKNGTYKKLKTVSETNYNNTGLKAKTTYYYKIRAIIKIGSKTYYGPYSSIVSKKTSQVKKDYSNVMEAANQIMSSQNDEEYIISRDTLRSELTWGYDFESDYIEYAISNVEVDWNSQAKKELELIYDSTLSRTQIIEYLTDLEYTEEEIEYAFSNVEIDLSENAYSDAYYNWEYYSEEGLRRKLLEDGFSEEDTESAINRVREYADYNESAKNIFNEKVEELMSLSKIENDLNDLLFSSSEIEEALSLSSDIDFNEIAFNRAVSVMDEYDNSEDMREYLSEALFTSEEVTYAVDLLFKPITSTIDLINLNDPIMVKFNSKGSECGYYIFLKTSTDIFRVPNEAVGARTIFEYYDGASEIIDTLELDDEVTNAALESLNNLPIQKGVSEMNAMISEGKIYMNSSRISLASNSFYGDLGLSFETLYDEYDSSIDTILNGAYLVVGACGSEGERPVRLTEELCSLYNLTCDRW